MTWPSVTSALRAQDLAHVGLGRGIFFSDPNLRTHPDRRREKLAQRRQRDRPLDALAFLPLLFRQVLRQFVADAVQLQALHARVFVRARVEAPVLIQLKELDAFMRSSLTGPRFDGTVARLRAKLFGEVPAIELLQQRAGFHQPEDVGQRGVGVNGHELEQQFMGTAGDVDLVQPTSEVVGLRSEGPHDQLGAGAQDQVLHRDAIVAAASRIGQFDAARSIIG
jgi:hypothetical protein